jgi:hypothetical protein
MSVNFRTTSLIESDTWTTGSGGFTGYIQNGSTSENERVNGTDPWGNTAVVWETRPSGGGGADGGWNTSSFSVDETKLYRFSVWMKRTSSTSGGHCYLGCSGNVTQLNGTTESNPYWFCPGTSTLTQNVWTLIVGHLWPSSYSSTDIHPDTGRWTIAGGRIGGVDGCTLSYQDCKFYPGTTTQYHRVYHYYCNDSTTRLQFFEPRVDLCNGTEPTIQDLLNGRHRQLLSTSISPSGSSIKTQRVVATGGDEIIYNGEWKIHRFNGSGTFTLTSFIGKNSESNLNIDYLIVAGGGGGGTNMGGGGGGGGALSGSTTLSLGSYTITVGGGGSGAPAGTGTHPTTVGSNGSNSSFNGMTAYGGGYGGLSPTSYGYADGNDGGCGGGASGYNNSGGGNTGGSGSQGGDGGDMGSAYYSGGGGGASGEDGASGNNSAVGGDGLYCDILSKPYYWGGGGGGAGYSIGGADGGKGGGGGGAAGFPAGNGGRDSVQWGDVGLGTCTSCQDNKPGGNGGTNSGGGGGGGSHYNYTNKGGDGGSGIVVIRYKYK